MGLNLPYRFSDEKISNKEGYERSQVGSRNRMSCIKGSVISPI